MPGTPPRSASELEHVHVNTCRFIILNIILYLLIQIHNTQHVQAYLRCYCMALSNNLNYI